MAKRDHIEITGKENNGRPGRLQSLETKKHIEMRTNLKRRTTVGIFFLALIIAINVYIAAHYYFLDVITVGEFYFWQGNS